MDIEQLAKRQLNDYDSHQPGGLFAGDSIPMTIGDAYALQFAVARLRIQRGERVAGYKVGCISAVMQAQLELDRPVFGHVFETEIRRSGATLNPDDFDSLAIEGEFAMRIVRDIPNENWLREHPGEAISSGFAVIELHNYVFRNRPHNAQELVGNNAIHAGAVLVEGTAAKRSISAAGHIHSGFERWCHARHRDRGGIARRTVRQCGGLAEHLACFGLFLEEGQIVLTGSPLPLYRVAKGDRIDVSCDRSETVSCLISGPSM